MKAKTGYLDDAVRSVCIGVVIAFIVTILPPTDATQSTEPNIEGEYICPDSWLRVPSVGRRSESFGWAACVRQNPSPLAWNDAQAECRGESGHLLILDDAFYSRYEQSSVAQDGGFSIIYNQLRSFINKTGFSSSWLGLRGSRKGLLRWEADTPTNYRSRVGTGVAVGISWSDNIADGESCGAVLDTNEARPLVISMMSCQQVMQSICVKPATKVLLGTYEKEKQCGEDWLWSADSEFCYQKGVGESTFADAQKSCVSQNASLATPTDSFLHNFTIAAFVYSILDLRSLHSDSTFWIGLYANSTTTSGDHWSYSYGTVEFDQKGLPSGCLAVKMNGYQRPSWYEAACDEQMTFICQKRKKHLGDPQFIVQPIDSHILSSELQGFQLGCRAYNVHPRRSVVWVKVDNPDSEDGAAYIDNGPPPSGNYLNLALVSVFLGVTNNAQLQGYYRCEVWGVDANSKRGRVASNTALVKFEDIVTFRGSIFGKPKTEIEYLNEVLSMMMTQANLRYELAYSSYDNRLANQTLNFAVYVHVNDTPNEESLQFEAPGHSLPGHSPPASPRAIAQTHATNRIHRKVIQQLSVTQYELIRKFSIRRTDACADWLMHVSDIDVITFPITPIGSTANSRELCVFDGKPLAVGRCTGDFTSGGVWTIESRPECIQVQNVSKSRVTETLAQLDRIVIDEMNMDSVTSSLVDLTRDSDELIPLDISYISSILSRVTEFSIDGNNETSDGVLEVVDNVIKCADERLFEAELLSRACSRIIASLDSFADHVVLPSDSSSLSVSRPNIAVNIYDLPLDNETSWIYGIEINELFGIEPITNFAMFDNDSAVDLHGAVVLSHDVLEMGRARKDLFRQSSHADEDRKFRISFITHSEGVLFQQRSELTRINSVVFSASVSGVKIENLNEPVTIVFRPIKATSSSQYCAFWDVGNESTGARWSTEGVETDTSMVNVTNTVVCRSRHLTNFAVIAGFDMHRETVVARALEAISIVGLTLSIIGLDLTILSQVVLFRKLKRSNSQLVLMHLSVSLLAVDILVIAGLDKVDNQLACKSVATLLLYFLLVSFSWMLVEAIVQYLKFVVVFNTYTSKFAMKTALPAYIVPGLIVAIVVILDVNGFETLQGPVSYCWLSRSAFNFAFLLPLGLIMLTNIVLFVMIIKGLTCDRGVGLQSNQSKKELVKLQVMALICCFIVMGLTWVFAFLAFGQLATVMHFLFCIFNSLQGFLIFAFLNVRERPVRRAWLKLFARCCSQTGESKSSDGVRPAISGNSSGAYDGQFNRRRLTFNSSGETDPSAPTRTSRNDAAYDKLTTDSTAI